MERNELLETLQNITFCASLTALTSEYCLEVEILTGDGVNYSWMGYDDWFLYELRGIAEDRWKIILNKLSEGTLSKVDLAGTDLGKLYEKQENNETYDCVDFFESLKSLPTSLPKVFYCTYEMGKKPIFYASENSMALGLKEEYSGCVKLWEDMSDEELEHWYDVYEYAAGMPCCYFDDTD